MHQPQSPQQRYMNVNDWKLWQTQSFTNKNYALEGMSAIERGKTFLTGAPHKTDLTSITQQCFIILGREGPLLSHICILYHGGSSDKYDTPCF